MSDRSKYYFINDIARRLRKACLSINKRQEHKKQLLVVLNLHTGENGDCGIHS